MVSQNLIDCFSAEHQGTKLTYKEGQGPLISHRHDVLAGKLSVYQRNL